MEILSKEKVFITGINGFTGKHLEDYLKKKGFEVYGTALNADSNNNHFKCDILSEDSLYKILNEIRPNYIIHLAAISFVAAKNQENIYNVNIFGTLNLLNAITRLNYNVQKIVIVSSAAVYGNIEGELNENMCPKPVNHYGNSKLAMENMTRSYFDKLNIIISRPFNYTGIGQQNHFLIPKIVSHFKDKKNEIELGNIDVYREFNDVSFVVKCYTEFMFSELTSEVVNVCSSKALSIKDILRLMSDISGHEITVKVNPELIRKNEIRVLKGSSIKLNAIVGNFVNEFDIKKTLEGMYLN